jgi:hypothetical protein
VQPLEAFIAEDLAAVTTMRDKFERERAVSCRL